MAAISAHSGGTEVAPPGTYAAYTNALQAGADYVEFDIRRTVDGERAVYHDAHVAADAPVPQISYAPLCQLAGRILSCRPAHPPRHARRDRRHADPQSTRLHSRHT